MKLAKKFSTEDEESAITAGPMNVATSTAKLTSRPSKPVQKGIVIRESQPQEQPKQHPEEETSDQEEDLEYKRKGTKKVKKAHAEPSRDSTPSPLRRARKQAQKGSMVAEAE